MLIIVKNSHYLVGIPNKIVGVKILGGIKPEVETLLSMASIIIIYIGLHCSVCSKEFVIDFKMISWIPMIWGCC